MMTTTRLIEFIHIALEWVGWLIVMSPGILFILFLVAIIGSLSESDVWRRHD